MSEPEKSKGRGSGYIDPEELSIEELNRLRDAIHHHQVARRYSNEYRLPELLRMLEEVKKILSNQGKEWRSLERWQWMDGQIRFWLNPKDLDNYQAGWFTIDELIEWTYDRGPVLVSDEDVEDEDALWTDLDGVRIRWLPDGTMVRVSLPNKTNPVPAQISFETDDDFIFSPSIGGPELLTYLQAIENLQHIIDDAQGRKRSVVRVRSIAHNSPINVSLEGASQAVETVKEIVSPWRRKHAETMARLREQQLEEEVANKRAEILEKVARAKKDREEAGRLAAEAEVKRAEAERIRTENQKLLIEINRAYVEMALEIIQKIHPAAVEAERIMLVTQLLPVLKTLAISPFQIAVDSQQ